MVEENMAYIYGLANPETGELRYVGKSVHPKRRLCGHLRASNHSHLTNWLKELKRQGLLPTLHILQTVPNDNWAWAERLWIATAKTMGARLVNGSPGGLGGSSKGLQFSEVGRARINAGIRRACKGRVVSAETREKMAAAKRGKPQSEAHRRAIGNGNRGKAAPEFREQLRVRWTGPNNPNYGKPLSIETKEKIGQALAKEYPAFLHRETGEVIPEGRNLS